MKVFRIAIRVFIFLLLFVFSLRSLSVGFSAGRFVEEYSGTGKFSGGTLVRRWNDSMDMAAI